jgi:hypothetical protein
MERKTWRSRALAGLSDHACRESRPTVPQPDRAVAAFRSQQPPVRQERDTPDRVSVALKRTDQVARMGIPDLDRIVMAAAGEQPGKQGQISSAFPRRGSSGQAQAADLPPASGLPA